MRDPLKEERQAMKTGILCWLVALGWGVLVAAGDATAAETIDLLADGMQTQ